MAYIDKEGREMRDSMRSRQKNEAELNGEIQNLNNSTELTSGYTYPLYLYKEQRK